MKRVKKYSLLTTQKIEDMEVINGYPKPPQIDNHKQEDTRAVLRTNTGETAKNYPNTFGRSTGTITSRLVRLEKIADRAASGWEANRTAFV